MKRLLLLLALALLVTAMTASAASAATNLITNGDFEAGNSGFTSGYAYIANEGPSALWNPGVYTVGDNPRDYHSLWSSFGPHGGLLMLIANGSQTAGDVVWESSSVKGLLPGHTYTLSAWVTSSYPASPADLVFTANNGISGTAIGGGVTAPAPGTWTEFIGSVVVPAGVTEGTFSIGNNNVVYGGNDFCIDDITLTDTSPVVGIDIKPGSDPSAFNWNGSGKVPVAILGSASFDVTQVNPATVQMNGAGVALKGKKDPSVMASYSDVNMDGFTDLVVQILDNDGAVYFTGTETSALVSGYLYNGTYFSGTGDIKLVPAS